MEPLTILSLLAATKGYQNMQQKKMKPVGTGRTKVMDMGDGGAGNLAQLAAIGGLVSGMGGVDTFTGMEGGVPTFDTTRNLSGGLNLMDVQNYKNWMNPYF
jgi:hypothetical protein